MSVGKTILQGLTEAVEYENGHIEARISQCSIAPVPELSGAEIKAIRLRFGMTQSTFAKAIGVSVKTVEAWEAGTNKPLGIARRFLSVLQNDPDIFTKSNIVTT